MTPNYSLRALAQVDLERIWLYTYEQWGVEQADNYLNLLFSRFTWIAKNPLIGKKRDDIKAGYYYFPEGMHLVFYTLTKNGIDIIGIPHQSMDVINHINSPLG
ncbi:MAG: type II toxin-antitoxin system RelE/ParE family toxin [Methylococcales bacterium]|nr:type II toxin-antitoxin system RelE/ParE family toxin [Methylococcales bacterium]